MENRLYTKKINAQNLFSKKKINNTKNRTEVICYMDLAKLLLYSNFC